MFVRSLSTLALAGPATSLAQCYGSDDPVIPSSGACYSTDGDGSDTAWSAALNLKSFARGKGTMDFMNNGGCTPPTFPCKDHSFTKSGQEISVASLSDCAPEAFGDRYFKFQDLKYCSASDTFNVTYLSGYSEPGTVQTYSELMTRVICQSCNGDGNPIVGCYKAHITPGGEPLDIMVDVDSFAGSKGSMKLSFKDEYKGKGFKCKDHTFTKSGQEISVDFSDCADPTLINITHCSVENTFHATLKFPMDTETVMLHFAGVPGSSQCASSAVLV